MARPIPGQFPRRPRKFQTQVSMTPTPNFNMFSGTLAKGAVQPQTERYENRQRQTGSNHRRHWPSVPKAISPTALKIALRSQRSPLIKSRAPTTSCKTGTARLTASQAATSDLNMRPTHYSAHDQ